MIYKFLSALFLLISLLLMAMLLAENDEGNTWQLTEILGGVYQEIVATLLIFIAISIVLWLAKKKNYDKNDDKEAEKTEELLKNGGAEDLKTRNDFLSIFGLELRDNQRSLHIAILTDHSLELYSRNETTQKWADNSARETERRRIVLLHESARTNSQRELLREVMSRFRNQCAENRVIYIEDLDGRKFGEGNKPGEILRKDCAVFMGNGENSLHLYFSYVSDNSQLRFAKARDTYYRTEDQGFARRIGEAFEAAWGDTWLVERSRRVEEVYFK